VVWSRSRRIGITNGMDLMSINYYIESVVVQIDLNQDE
jgi:hypothetical protein